MAFRYGSEFDDIISGHDEINAYHYIVKSDGFVIETFGGLIGYDGNDVITGGNLCNYIDGGAGNDRLVGMDGNDAILHIESQNDDEDPEEYYQGGIYGGAGNDNIDGGNGSDLLDGGDGDDIITGGTGSDRSYEITSEDSDLYNFHSTLTAGLYGGNGNDRLVGDAGSDYLDGGNGNDTLIGGPDDDNTIVHKYDYYSPFMREHSESKYTGGLFGGAGDDSLDGGTGVDLLKGDAGNDVLKGGDGNDRVSFVEYDDSVEISSDMVIAGLYGGKGDDKLDGGAGHDDLYGDEGNDLLIGGTGDDRLHGGKGNDILRGGIGNDTLQGNEGNDKVFADAGNDRLGGGAGADTLTGGAGADKFVFNSEAAASKQDVIADFQRRLDKIVINDIDANSQLSGNQQFDWISTAAFTGKAGEARYSIVGNNTYVYLNLDKDAQAEYSIKLNGIHQLSSADFFL